MGETCYLGDRDGVRTPMQWSVDRNAGFSRADFAQLYLPPLMDPVYGYQACNVEASLRSPSSFIHWMKRMLEVRKQHPLFGTGSFQVLDADNPAVFAYLRQDGDDRVICVNNLSRAAQPAQLPLAELAGLQPVELIGRVQFPVIEDKPYFVTLGPHAFYWFQLVAQS
jgi:maltose alpha-D-glucosyltransferase/alpha-amylase